MQFGRERHHWPRFLSLWSNMSFCIFSRVSRVGFVWTEHLVVSPTCRASHHKHVVPKMVFHSFLSFSLKSFHSEVNILLATDRFAGPCSSLPFHPFFKYPSCNGACAFSYPGCHCHFRRTQRVFLGMEREASCLRCRKSALPPSCRHHHPHRAQLCWFLISLARSAVATRAYNRT